MSLSRALLALALAVGAAGASPFRSSAQDTHALIVVGVSGEAEYADRFHEWASSFEKALLEKHGFTKDRVRYLGEDVAKDPALIQGLARKETILAWITETAAKAAPNDRIMIVLFGHGAAAGSQSVHSILGPDLPADSLSKALQAFPTQSIGVVNTTSGSGPYVQALSGPRRTILTATRTARELNETWFGKYFVEAFTGDVADLDKDKTVSLYEAYEYARRETARFYTEQALMLTEHSMIDDNGDAKGSFEPTAESGDGTMAKAFITGRTTATVPATVSDPVLRKLMEERAALDVKLAELRAKQATMAAADYDKELEAILTDIALKDREIRARGGGGA
jgi:hypothetical protein